MQVTRLVEERVSFMAPVIHILMPERLHRYDFSFVYEIMSTGFSMAIPVQRDRWQALYYPLSGLVWTATLLALLLTPVALVMVRFFCHPPIRFTNERTSHI